MLDKEIDKTASVGLNQSVNTLSDHLVLSMMVPYSQSKSIANSLLSTGK